MAQFGDGPEHSDYAPVGNLKAAFLRLKTSELSPDEIPFGRLEEACGASVCNGSPTLVHYAASYGRLETVMHMLAAENHSQEDAATTEQPPQQDGWMSIPGRLVRRLTSWPSNKNHDGVNLEVTDAIGNTPLHYAGAVVH